jgi:hypothetical protein
MKFLGEKINGCVVLGKDVKDLIFSLSGVLIYKKHSLIFLNASQLKEKRLWVKEEAMEPVVFASNEFGDLEQIKDGDRRYIMEFNGGFLFLRDAIVGDVKIEIRGKTY